MSRNMVKFVCRIASILNCNSSPRVKGARGGVMTAAWPGLTARKQLSVGHGNAPQNVPGETEH